MVVGISKTDLPETRDEIARITEELTARGLEVFPFCSATGEGVPEVLTRLEQLLHEYPPGYKREKKFLNKDERPTLHGDGKPPVDEG